MAVIGFDSLDFELTRKWASEGHMPNFQRLFDQASWGSVDNPLGIEAGAVWASFTTGQSPGRHGLFNGNYRFDPERYQLRTITLEERGAAPVWKLLGDAGLRVAVVDAPYELLEQQLNGVQVTDWLPHVFNQYPGPSTYPPELAQQLVAKYGENPFEGPNRCATNDSSVETAADVIALRDGLLDRLTRKTAFCVELMHEEPWDYYLAVFEESHDIGHMCWHVHDPSHEAHDPEMAQITGDPLLDIYKASDVSMGQFMDALAPDQDLMVFTSHGMGPERTASGFLDTILEKLEACYAQGDCHAPATHSNGKATRPAATHGKGDSESDWIGSVYRALVPEQLRKRVRKSGAMKQRYADLYTAQMRARDFFEVTPNHATGGVRINLKGREGYGRIEPGPEYRALRKCIASDLLEMTNADTGEPLVTEAMAIEDLYEGPRVSYLPDLLVEWNKTAPINRVHSPKFGTIERKRKSVRTGDHVSKRGGYFVLGPGFKPGEGDAVRAEDFAPTISQMLGVEASEFEGQPICGLVGTKSAT